MKRIPNLIFVLAIVLLMALPAMGQSYDLVILNGRVMDPETKYDAVANVGIKDGSIAAITEEKITGKKTIDATGHVVAPGFIDIHAHSQNNGTLVVADGKLVVDAGPGRPIRRTAQTAIPEKK
jgi:adenine deaminase